MAKLISILILLLLKVTTTVAYAQQFDSRVLFSKGAWAVELVHNTSEGTLWCSAQTANRNGQSFSITAYESNDLVLFVFDPNWSLQPRQVKFIIDVDYERWTIVGEASNISVSLNMNEPEKSVRFLTDLKQGSAAAVYTNQLERVAVFSLNGSSAAIDALFECWKSISKSKDPFGQSADPFG